LVNQQQRINLHTSTRVNYRIVSIMLQADNLVRDCDQILVRKYTQINCL
jgi:hypothetical protein